MRSSSIGNNEQPAIPALLRKKAYPKDIRQTIDQNIYEVYQYIRKNTPTDTIPVVNADLIMSYVNKIYNDYDIPDPLVLSPERYRGIEKFKPEIREQPISPVKKLSINYKALLLKQNFRHYLTNSTQINSFKLSPFKELLLTPAKLKNQQIRQIFRYCFLCQQPILEANIDYHQKEQCQDFHKLYNMTLSQIGQILRRKIVRLKEKITLNFQQYLASQKVEGYSLKYQQGSDFNKSMSTFIGQLGLIIQNKTQRHQFNDIFATVCQSAECFLGLLEISEKVYWFGNMLKTIQDILNEKIQNRKSNKYSVTMREQQQSISEENVFSKIHFPKSLIQILRE